MDTPIQKKTLNRRGALRKPPRRSIRLQCRRGALGLGANVGHALLDISETGVRLVTKHMLEPGAEVEIVLEGYGMPGPIRRLGRVRWAVPTDDGHCCTGVHFDKLLSFRDVQTLAAP